MDNSTFQMCNARYNVALTEDFNVLRSILCFYREFKGICEEGNLTVFRLRDVEVVRIKSKGDIDIRGKELDVLGLEELFEIMHLS